MTGRPVRIAVQLRSQHAASETIRDRAPELEDPGLSGPSYDLAVAPDWLAWRDQKNAQ